MIFDTHAHYDDEIFEKDREEIFARFKETGIGRVVNVAAAKDSIGPVLDLAHQYDFVYAALGIHPSECEGMSDALLDQIREGLHDEKTVALGEIGLDYHWDTPDRATQQYWFERQLALAIDENMPVIIHSRDAAKDTMDLMQKMDAGKVGGVIHCYSYSLEMAKEWIEMGFYIGVGGVITFKNAKKLTEVVEGISLGHIILETDCPYMAPEPHRGERNSSLFLPYVVQKIAELKGVTPETVVEQTQKNAERMYRLA